VPHVFLPFISPSQLAAFSSLKLSQTKPVTTSRGRRRNPRNLGSQAQKKDKKAIRKKKKKKVKEKKSFSQE
jgi:hypothetical protein